MLKIDRISLAENDFDLVELCHLTGKAVVKIDNGEVAAGKFRMSNGGMCTMCAIDAGGKWDGAKTLKHPSKLTVELSGVIKRDFVVGADQTSVDTRCKEITGARIAGNSEWVTELSTDAETGHKLFTVTASDKERVVTLELDVAVGKGTAADGNVNHQLKITPDNEEGLMHFAMLCNVGTAVDHKANRAHFEVRGSKPWKTIGKGNPVGFSPAKAAEKS